MRVMWVVLVAAAATAALLMVSSVPSGVASAQQDVILPPKDDDTPVTPKAAPPATPPPAAPAPEKAPKPKEAEPESKPVDRGPETEEEGKAYEDLKKMMDVPAPSTGDAEADRKASTELLTKISGMCDEFLTKYPTSSKAPEIMFQKALMVSQMFVYNKGKEEYRTQALEVAAQLIAKYPQDDEALNAHHLRMQIYRSWGKYAEAIDEAKKIAAEFPKKVEDGGEALYTVYDIYRKLKDNTKADAATRADAAAKVDGALKEVADRFPTSGYGRKARGMMDRPQLPGKTIEMEFNTVDGKTLKLSELRGKVVLVVYWASYSSSSIDLEKVQFRALYDKYSPEGLTVIAVNVDTRKSLFQDALGKLGSTPWVQCCDEKGLVSPMATPVGVSGIPSSVLVDRQGKIYGVDLEQGKDLKPAVASLIDKK